jgi:hypothetical protein
MTKSLLIARLLEALIAALCCVQLRLQMRVRDKEKGKILRRWW